MSYLFDLISSLVALLMAEAVQASVTVTAMNIWELIYYGSSVVSLMVAYVFISHAVYDDGLVGRIGLAGIGSTSALVVIQAVFGAGLIIQPVVALQAAAFSAFMVWHLFRFHRRVLMQKKIDPEATAEWKA